MANKLHNICHRDDSDNGSFAATAKIERVEGLSSQVFFKLIYTGSKRQWVADYSGEILNVFSKTPGIELSNVEVQNSVWTYDANKKYILLAEPGMDNMIVVPRPEDLEDDRAESEEDFQRFLDSLRPLSESFQMRIKTGRLADEDKADLLEEIEKTPNLAGLSEEEQERRLKLFHEKQQLNGYFNVVDKKERKGSDRRSIIFVVLLFLLLGILSLFLVRVDIEPPESAKAIQTVTPTMPPTISLVESTLAPSEGSITSTPTFKPTINPTTMNPSMSPTETSTTMNPSMSPTGNPTTTNPSMSPTENRTTMNPSMSPTVNPTTIMISTPSVQETAFETSAPSFSPTSSPTQLPAISRTELPTSYPTVRTLTPTTFGKISRLSCKQIRDQPQVVSGKNGKDNFKMVKKAGEKYCGDTFGGVDEKDLSRNPWSVRRGRKDCPEFNYSVGFKKCDSVGARWCTLEELQLSVARGTGCNADKQLVYTNTYCVTESGERGKFMYAPESPNDSAPQLKCEIDLERKSIVRCCGDADKT